MLNISNAEFIRYQTHQIAKLIRCPTYQISNFQTLNPSNTELRFHTYQIPNLQNAKLFRYLTFRVQTFKYTNLLDKNLSG